MYLNKSNLQLLAVDSEGASLMSKTTKASIFSDCYWDQVENLITLLKPIALWITIIEGDRPQISSVARMFSEISDHFKTSMASSPLTKSDQNKAIEALSARREFCIKIIHKAANLLDPKYIGKHVTEDEIIDAMQFVSEAAKHLQDCESDKVLADLANYRSKRGLWSKSFIWKSCDKVDPLAWWKGMCSSRPLAKVAVMILSLPSTSAACERSFSTYGNIQTAKRNRLTIKRASKLVFIQQNLKLSSIGSESEAAITSESDHTSLTSEPVIPSTSFCGMATQSTMSSEINKTTNSSPSDNESIDSIPSSQSSAASSYAEFPEDYDDSDDTFDIHSASDNDNVK